MEVSDIVNTFRFGTIKKEPTVDENSFHPVKQEYYSEPELYLDWDEKHNIDNLNPENGDSHCNKLSKLYNPIVLLERLPDAVLANNCNLRYLNSPKLCNGINLKTEILHAATESFDNFSENTYIEHEGEGVTLGAKNLSDTRVHPIRIKASRLLKKGLTNCGRNAVLQCDHCSFKTKQEISLQKHIKKMHSDDLQTCSKCNKKFKYKKSLAKHSTYCNGGTIVQTNQHPYKTKKKNHLKNAIILKELQDEKACSKCGRKYKNQQCSIKHSYLSRRETFLQCDYCSHKTKTETDLKKHILAVNVEKDVYLFLPCPKCGKRYKNNKSLKSHLRLCGKEPHLQCDQCSYKTYKKDCMKKHIVGAHVDKDVNLFLPCSKCGRRYKNHPSLFRHSYLCGREPHFHCDHCSYKTKTKSDLAKHIIAMHLEKDVYLFLPCSKCGKKFKNNQSLKSHLHLCGKEPHLQCDHCSYKTNNHDRMKKHILAAHVNKDVNLILPCSKCGRRYKNHASLFRHSYLCGREPHFHCDHCSYKTKTKTVLARHIVAVHLEKDVNYFLPCSKCGRRYKNQGSLIRHSNLCGKELHFQCDNCCHKTKTKADLAKHIVAAHVEKDVYLFLPCSKCGKRYKNQHTLKSHLYICGKVRHLQCDHCSYNTNTKNSMKKHVIRVHVEKDKNLFLPCLKCARRYKNQASLFRHSYLCGREPHFQCDHCSYKTKTKSDLARHIVAVHVEKDVNFLLPCSKCGRRYKNHQSLARHLSLCGKELHLQCDYCPYRTNMKSSLSKHILGVHLNRTKCYFLSCLKCGKTLKNKLYLKQHSKLCVKKIFSSM